MKLSMLALWLFGYCFPMTLCLDLALGLKIFAAWAILVTFFLFLWSRKPRND